MYLKFLEFLEGKLMKMCVVIVWEDSLVKFVKECYFDNYILLGKGEEVLGGWICVLLLCDLFEVFLGVFYLD